MQEDKAMRNDGPTSPQRSDPSPLYQGWARSLEKSEEGGLHDDLFRMVQDQIGHDNMTVDNIVRAIEKGVGEEVVLELQHRMRTDEKHRIGQAFSDEVYQAIRRYRPTDVQS